MKKTLKIFEQTFWQILGKGITSLSTFIILGIVARTYGKEGTGTFTLALTYLAIFYLIADFGFNAHALRKFKTQMSNVKSEWQYLMGTRLMWSTILVVLAVTLLPFLPFATPIFARSILLGSLAIIGSAVFVTCNLIFQSKLRYDLSVLASGFGTLISLVVFLMLSSQKFPVFFLLLAHFIGWIVIAAGALFLVRKFLHSVTPYFNLQYTVDLFKQSWPIAMTLTLNVIYFRADSFMIAYFKSVSDVGIYNVAYCVFQSALVLPTFIMNAYYPLMLKSLSGIKYAAVGLLSLSLIGVLLTIIFADLIIKILTGGGFNGSAQSLQILSLGFPAYFVSSLLMWLLITKGRYKIMFLLYTLGLIFNIVLNFIYIPRYSFIGASWITVVSEYFILLLQAIVLLRKK